MKVSINAITISPGGGQTVLINWVKYFLSRNCEVIVYVGNVSVKENLELHFLSEKLNVELKAKNRSSWFKFSWSVFILPILIRLKETKIHLSFNNNFVSLNNTLSVVNHINLLHYLESSGDYKKVGIFQSIKDKAAWTSFKYTDLNIFESEIIKEMANKKLDTKFDSDVVYNPCQLYEEQIVTDKKFNRLFMVTSQQPHKRNECIIQVLQFLNKSQFSDWEVHVVGVSEFDFLNENNELYSQFQFHGRINSREKLGALLSSGLVMICPSEVESFCMTAIEGMNVGLIPLAFDVSTMKESIGHDELIFSDLDFQAMAGRVIEIRESSTYRSNLSEFCYKRAQKFTFESFAMNIDIALGKRLNEF